MSVRVAIDPLEETGTSGYVGVGSNQSVGRRDSAHARFITQGPSLQSRRSVEERGDRLAGLRWSNRRGVEAALQKPLEYPGASHDVGGVQ